MSRSTNRRTVIRSLSSRVPPPDVAQSHDGKIACRLNAQLDTTIAAGRRLLQQLQDGTTDFVLTAADGSMSARVRLSIEGIEPATHAVSRRGVTVDWSRAVVASGPSRVALSNTELRLLAALLEGNGAPVSRPILVERVWPADSLPIQDRENALAVYVCSLRKRLATVGLGSALETVRGVGYRISL